MSKTQKWMMGVGLGLLLYATGYVHGNVHNNDLLEGHMLQRKQDYAASYAKEKHEADSLSVAIEKYQDAQRNGPNKDRMYAVYSGHQGNYGVKWMDADDLDWKLSSAIDHRHNSRRNASDDSTKLEMYRYVLNEAGADRR